MGLPQQPCHHFVTFHLVFVTSLEHPIICCQVPPLPFESLSCTAARITRPLFLSWHGSISGGYEYDGGTEIGRIKDEEVRTAVRKDLREGIRSFVISGVFSPVNSCQEAMVKELVEDEIENACVKSGESLPPSVHISLLHGDSSLYTMQPTLYLLYYLLYYLQSRWDSRTQCVQESVLRHTSHSAMR